MTEPRDYSAMLTMKLKCAICDEGMVAPDKWDGWRLAHWNAHLAAGEAIVVKAFGQPDKVVPRARPVGLASPTCE